MTANKSFLLPDLGEGLPDATVVEWFVPVGGLAKLDEPLVAMETAKAVVEVPSPCSGILKRIGGPAGSVVVTGTLLA
jgi:2-oxoisovalerate dehydrogenase E2 component (dihydrolipoyl transacylase)